MTSEERIAVLEAENAHLRQQVALLEEELAAAEERIGELERGKRRRAPLVKPNRPRGVGPRAARRKRDAEHNRSRRCEKPTKVVVHKLERCPDCGCKLYRYKEERRRQVIDLPPPQAVEVTEHRVVKGYCLQCERWRAPRVDMRGQVLGQGRIGVRLVSVMAYLRTALRLPYRSIQEYLETMHRVHVSIGEVVEVLHQLRREVQPVLRSLREEMRRSSILHLDETGWREDGLNGYIWACSTPSPEGVRYYEYDRSRGQKVVRRLLGAQFAGVLSSDFYGGYNMYLGRHQRCWVHLLRDLHELQEEQAGDQAVVGWVEAVKGLYEEAQGFLNESRQHSQEEREQKYVELLKRLQLLGLAYAREKKHPCQALAKRLLRHQDELFLFLVVDGLSANNNLAERSLRPLVVARKISGGTRSAEGSKTRMALASLFETWRARALNPFTQCFALLAQPP